MYKYYIFDLYGTLVDIRTNEKKTYLWNKMSELYSSFGILYTPKELKKTFDEIKKQLEDEVGKLGEPDYSRLFWEIGKRKNVDCDSQMIAYLAVTFRVLSRNQFGIYDGVKETLQELKQQGKGIYLLSNAQALFTRPELEQLQLISYFDKILISSEVGYKKPSKEFYNMLFTHCGLKPEECLMVGNDETCDIVGAHEVGMDALYIHTEISPEFTGKSKPEYAVMDGDWGKVRKILTSFL